MIYPGYLLNPGDLFQVEPETVLFATGAPKDSEQKRAGRQIHRARRNGNVSMEKMRAQIAERKASNEDKASEKDSSEALISSKSSTTTLQDNPQYRKARRDNTIIMIRQAEKRQSDKGKSLSAKQKQQIRAFIKHAKAFQSRIFTKPIKELEKERLALVDEFQDAVPSHAQREKDIQAAKKAAKEAAEKAATEAAIENAQDADDVEAAPKSTKKSYGQRLSEEKIADLEKHIAGLRLGSVDPSKPYATPWRPRDFMSAFAFIPRYLEVNPKICSAVYLRHPVARPGLTEVPTPFPGDIQQLAFTWYLRRR